MKTRLLGLGLLFSTGLMAQHQQEVIIADFVKIKNGKEKETMFYYENNWKPLRDAAIQRGFISGYQLLRSMPDTLNNFDLVLVTVYADSSQFNKAEENFRALMRETRTGGPALLNDLKPSDFRQNVFVKKLQWITGGSRKDDGVKD